MVMATGISTAAVAVFNTHMLNMPVMSMMPKSSRRKFPAAGDNGIERQTTGQPVFAQRFRQKEAAQDQKDHRLAKRRKRALRIVDAQGDLRDGDHQRRNGQRRRFQGQNAAGEDEERQRRLALRTESGRLGQEHDKHGQADDDQETSKVKDLSYAGLDRLLQHVQCRGPALNTAFAGGGSTAVPVTRAVSSVSSVPLSDFGRVVGGIRSGLLRRQFYRRRQVGFETSFTKTHSVLTYSLQSSSPSSAGPVSGSISSALRNQIWALSHSVGFL